MSKDRGITLIVLVVTIIVLIILAMISINLVFDTNLIERVTSAKELNEIESIREKLELVKASMYIDNIGEGNIDEYFTSLNKEKIEPYIVTEMQKMTEVLGVIEVNNKYSFLIRIENNIEIEYEGKVGEIVRKDSIIEVKLSGVPQQSTLPIKLTAEVTDNGEKLTSGKWVLNIESENIGTDETLYTGNIFQNESINLEIQETGKYYLHILTIDMYGRAKETIKGPITVMEKYHMHTGSTTEGGGCYTIEEKNDINQNCVHASKNFDFYERGTFSGYYTYIFHYGAGTVTECTYIPADRRVDTGYADGRDIGDISYRHEVKIGEEIIGYLIGCEKTEETMEGYNVNY